LAREGRASFFGLGQQRIHLGSVLDEGRRVSDAEREFERGIAAR